jgi:hypothetical protein
LIAGGAGAKHGSGSKAVLLCHVGLLFHCIRTAGIPACILVLQNAGCGLKREIP